MRKLLFFSVLALLFLPLSYSYGFSEKGQDCSKCHTLSKDEAAELLKEFGQVKILEVTASPVKSMWEVDVEAGGKKIPVYVDFSKKFMISGAIVSIKEKKNLTQERLTEINKVDVAQIPLDDALIMGDKKAKHKIIVFDDPA
jgi:thiol:disulfide interchange protein DsbC